MSTLQTTKAAGALAGLGNLKAGLAKVQQSIPAAGGEPILRMGRDGKWIYGAENIEVEAGSEWAVNPLSLQHGFICWKKTDPNNKADKPEKLGEILVSMFEDKPLLSSLPDYGHPWAEQTCVGLRCISGEDEGEQTEYKPSSVGGANAMKELIGKIMAQLDTDEAHPVPVVVLKSDHYQHKTYGKTYTPLIEIVDWISMDGVAADDGTADAPDGSDAGDAPAEEAPAEEPKTAAAPRRAARTPTVAAKAEEPAAEETAPEQPAPATGGEVRRRRR